MTDTSALPPLEPKLPVILLHGLAVAPFFMWHIGWRLRRAGFTTHNIGYNSYHTTIPEIAQRVAAKVRALGHDEVHAVGHSMGGVILRWAVNHASMPRIRRAVLVGPPNQGAAMADLLTKRIPWIVGPVVGNIVWQLRRGDLGLPCRAGPLEGTEVGIIAGGKGSPQGMISWIKGDNDRMVAVEETMLAGMSAFALVRRDHTLQLVSRRVSDLAIRFLESGRFRENTAAAQSAEDEDPVAAAS